MTITIPQTDTQPNASALKITDSDRTPVRPGGLATWCRL